jgi:hypothetical protein
MIHFKDVLESTDKLAADVDSTFALEPGRRSRQRQLLQMQFTELKATMAKAIASYVSQVSWELDFDNYEGGNHRCLEGMICPHCKSLEPFDIMCESWMIVYDDPEQGDHDPRDSQWHEDGECICLECHYVGRVTDFRAPFLNAKGDKLAMATQEEIDAYWHKGGHQPYRVPVGYQEKSDD